MLLVFERKATKNRLFSWLSKAKMVEKSAFFNFQIAKTAQKSAFFETFFGRKKMDLSRLARKTQSKVPPEVVKKRSTKSVEDKKDEFLHELTRRCIGIVNTLPSCFHFSQLRNDLESLRATVVSQSRNVVASLP